MGDNGPLIGIGTDIYHMDYFLDELAGDGQWAGPLEPPE